MDTQTKLRTTTGIVDRIERDGMVFVYEENSRKLGFLDNHTPVTGHIRLKRGMRLTLDVEDRGNVMVVAAARATDSR